MGRLVKQSWRRSCLKVILALSLYFSMTAFKTYPLILHLGTHIPDNPGDPLLNVWIMAWDFHALTTNPWNLFNANIYYPASNTLALSEHLLGVLPIFAPTYALTGNPILAYNMVFFLSFALSGVAMFLLVHYWTQHFWAALVAGFLFAFVPIRFEQFGHLQLLNLYWAPLALLWLEKFLRSQSWKDLAGFSIFYWLQVLSSVYLGWFTTIAIALYVVYVAGSLIKRAMFSRFAIFALLSALILLPVHFPYYQMKQQWGFLPWLQQCINYSNDLLLSYITVSGHMNNLYLSIFSVFRQAWQSDPYERVMFPGLVMALLLVLAIVPGRGFTLTAHFKSMKRSYLIVLISSFILSLGPYLIILGRNTDIPLPYLLLYHLAPGFQAMRVPARFGFMVMLAASVLSALGLLRLYHLLNTFAAVRKLPIPVCYTVVALSCIVLFTLELGCKPLSLIRMPVGLEVPEVYRWLAAEKPGPLVELPAGMWENYKYEYFSTYHWLPLVNGASGYGLPTYGQLVQQLQPLPTREGVMSLSAVGVKAVVVHYDQLPLHEALQWHLAAVELGLEQVAEFGSDLVYRTPASDSTHELELKLLTPDRLPISASIRVGLLVRGMHDRMWLSPRLSQRERVIVEWIEQSTGQTLIEEGSLEWPLASGAKPTTPMGVSVHTPFTQGRYLLTLQIPAFDRKTAPQSIELASNPFPTSANAPQMVSAAYAWEGPQPQLVTTGSIPMRVRTVNTGRAIWLADAEGVRGSVYLGWRWYKEDQEISGLGGREPLTYDVFPGQAFTFQSRIIPPSEPGEYRLDLELFSDLVRRFASRDEPPLQLTVHVLRIVKSDFDTWLTEQSRSIADPPQLTVSTDQRRYRRGDILNLLVTMDVASSAQRQTVDASLAVVWPDGREVILGEGGFVPFIRGRLEPRFRAVKLRQWIGRRAVVPIALQSAEMPYGPYTVYLLLTEPNTSNVIAKAEALFSLEP